MRRLPKALAAVTVVLGVVLVAGYWSGAHAPMDLVADGRRALGVDLRSSMVPTNGIRLHVVEAGPPDGPPVLLLHGYPEFWWGWSKQIPLLAAAGFRVIVPDQRGYNASDKPDGVEAYRIPVLVADVIGLLDTLEIARVDLAAHDWGGAVAWYVALEHPDRVRRLVVFNAVHPLAWVEARAGASEEDTIDWFRTFFRLPWLPEIGTRFADWHLVATSLRDTSRPGTFDDAELGRYRAAWARDGAMSSMIDWYRAAFRYPYAVAGDGTVAVPTRIVWGMQDRFFPTRVAALSAKHCRDVALVEVADAGHWLLHEEPARTSREMIEFFREG